MVDDKVDELVGSSTGFSFSPKELIVLHTSQFFFFFKQRQLKSHEYIR